MEKIEGIDVLHVDPGDFLKIDIDIQFSKKMVIDIHELKEVMAKAIVDYYGDDVHRCY